MQTDTSRALAHNAVIQIGGKVISTLLGIFTIAVLLRHLGDFGYGEFTTAITFLSLFAIVVDFGLTLTTIQMISEDDADEHKILGNLFSLRVVTGIVFFILAPIIALAFPYSETIRTTILVGAFAYFFSSTFQMLIGIFQKRLQMWRVVVGEVANRTIFLIGVLLVAYFNAGIVEIVAVLAIGNLTQFLLIILLARPFVHLKAHFDFVIWKEIFHRSWPIGLSIFFNLLYLKGDIIFMSVMRGQAEIGLYGGAYKIVDVVTALPVMFMGLVLPILVRSWSKGNKDSFKETMQHTFDFFMITALPIAVGAFALAEPIMVLVGGETFRGSGEVLKILAPTSAVVFIGALYGHAIVALNKQKPMVLGYAAVAVLTVIGYLLFIPTHGMFGAAWVTLFSEVLIAIIAFLVVWRVSGAFPNIKVSAKAITACALMYGTLQMVPGAHVLIQVAIGALVYTTTIIAFGGVKVQTIKSFLGR